MLRYIAEKVLGNKHKKLLKKFNTIVTEINSLEKDINSLSDEELKSKTVEFKNLVKNGSSLDSIMPSAFAVIRETAKRILGERHYDVQLLGGIVLHNGMIAEMKTGEGKTLSSSLAIYLNALEGRGVHVVTVNDYLAKRDAKWMGKIYEFHELTVGYITNEMEDEERKNAYNCDITYGSNNEFGFDYLRDNLKHDSKLFVQRPFNFAIIDEVDSILIDESRTPLIISGAASDNTDLYYGINKIVKNLSSKHCEIDEKNKTVLLTDEGNDYIEEALKKRGLINKESNLYNMNNMHIVHHVNQAIKAHNIFTKDKDYIVNEGKVLIIDEFTGRIMDGRRYSEGLHQAIEAKENLTIQDENQTLASISFQNYFRMYPKIAGMTGTAATEAEEFLNIYGLKVAQIPTNLPIKRIDEDDVIYKTENAKYNALINEIKKAHNNKQPILIGTISIEKSEFLSKRLKKEKITHKVLNAKYHEQEAEIISQAGRLGSVTIATNMAGRGTDIKLGGDENSPNIDDATKEKIKKQRAEVLNLGGLFVIGTERHESRRIDDQLRGRSGRQGDPGRTKFFLSLEDDLMRIFGSSKISYFLEKLGLKDDEAIEHPWINKAIQKAQQKVEARNYEIRKNLLRFDNVLNEQRKIIYQQRSEILDTTSFYTIIKSRITELNKQILDKFLPEGSYLNDNKELLSSIHRIYDIKINIEPHCEKEKILDIINHESIKKLENKNIEFGEEIFNLAVKKIMLMNLDFFWKEHIHSLEEIKKGINLRAYGQKDPLNEYKFEAFKLFEEMFFHINEEIISNIMKIYSSNKEKASTKKIENYNKITRNALCPCNSGLKFKHCHGKI